MASATYHRVVDDECMGANVNQGGSHAAYIWYKNGDVFAPQAVVGINFIQDDEVGTPLCVCVCV